jgi:hypothetical protein
MGLGHEVAKMERRRSGCGKNGKDRRSFAFAWSFACQEDSVSPMPFWRTGASGCERPGRIDKLGVTGSSPVPPTRNSGKMRRLSCLGGRRNSRRGKALARKSADASHRSQSRRSSDSRPEGTESLRGRTFRWGPPILQSTSGRRPVAADHRALLACVFRPQTEEGGERVARTHRSCGSGREGDCLVVRGGA